MPLIAAYFRPDSLDEALTLLTTPHRTPLAGGTVLNADRSPSDLEVVDLQALGLNDIAVDEASGSGTARSLRIGATATLAEISEHPAMPAALARIARAELPSTLRTLATIGGSVASGDGDSVLLAALLVHDAVVELALLDSDGVRRQSQPLPELLRGGVPSGALITAVTIDPDGVTADAATGRTPADVPIVAAVARSKDGAAPMLALTGVAATPTLADSSDPVAGLDPPGDFRGSAPYRLELAKTLSARALEGVR